MTVTVEVEVVNEDEGVGACRRHKRGAPKNAKRSGAKWREREKWNELAGSKSGAGGPADAPIIK